MPCGSAVKIVSISKPLSLAVVVLASQKPWIVCLLSGCSSLHVEPPRFCRYVALLDDVAPDSAKGDVGDHKIKAFWKRCLGSKEPQISSEIPRCARRTVREWQSAAGFSIKQMLLGKASAVLQRKAVKKNHFLRRRAVTPSRHVEPSLLALV